VGSSDESQLRELGRVRRQLLDARRKVAEFERERDQLICELRAAGVASSRLADAAGLSPGRVTQITDRDSARQPRH
jgi:hypothetical protein